MSSSYDSSRSRRRGAWGHWVPLVLTVAVATAGVAAWAWSQRSTEEEEEEQAAPDLDYENADYGDNPAYGASGPTNYGTAEDPSTARAAGAPHTAPQQFLANAGKTLAAGAGAVGAAMGVPWRPYAKKTRPHTQTTRPGRKKRRHEGTPLAYLGGPSILSHIPRNTEFAKVKLFVLIYAPGLKENALEATVASNPRPPSLSSSFSNIGHEQVTTPGEEIKSPSFKTSSDRGFNAVYSQALSLVEKDSMIMPFTSPNGHVHILRHLQPEIVYLQESLAGDNGSHITQLQTWLRHDVILIVGANGGHGGLADSESGVEEPDEKADHWWQREERVGRGRGVVVVDSVRVGDDWERRVQGKE
ncbi:peroxin 22-like protein [Apiospora phragmitis]|uniref:Peroxin 22-like protein n=1 Tax=Apiospora phragmitis TaxID=2905665 RepID=A0ABR1WVN9_9PEZI